MKNLPFLFAVLGLTLAGCASISDATDSMRQKFGTRGAPRVQSFAAEPRVAYTAARTAAEQLDFRYVRGGPAQGVLEAVSGLSAGSSLQPTRQIRLTAHLAPALDGGTEVSLWLEEFTEADASKGSGQTVGQPLQDTGLYEAFFRNLRQALQVPAK